MGSCFDGNLEANLENRTFLDGNLRFFYITLITFLDGEGYDK